VEPERGTAGKCAGRGLFGSAQNNIEMHDETPATLESL